MQIGDRYKNKAAGTKMHKCLVELPVFLYSHISLLMRRLSLNPYHIKDVKKINVLIPCL